MIKALVVCSALLAGAALAQERVYRCGNSYADAPCPAAVTVDVDDRRTAGQRHEANLLAQRDRQLAEVLSRERRQREGAASRQGAGHIGPARAASAPEKPARPKAPRERKGRSVHDDARLTPPLKALGRSQAD